MAKNKFNLSDYDDRYFKWHKDRTRAYAIKTMDWYVENYKPSSVIDYGCGIGAYLESALSKGITNLKGFDIGGEYVKKYTEKSVQPFIEYLDCTKPIITEKYDCVISLETGEHIETSFSEAFVQNIVNSTSPNGTILYSAAQPGQGGTGHINCQTKDFWISLFNKHGFVYSESLTKKITTAWSELKAPGYIIKNLIVLKRE